MKTTFLIMVGLMLPILSTATSLVPPPPQIKATSYILLDAETNTVIAEYGADETNPPASLTKIMTTYLVEQMIQRGVVERSQQVPVSIKAWAMRPLSIAFLSVRTSASCPIKSSKFCD